jgi:hypothetical protein
MGKAQKSRQISVPPAQKNNRSAPCRPPSLPTTTGVLSPGRSAGRRVSAGDGLESAAADASKNDSSIVAPVRPAAPWRPIVKP